MSDDDVPLICDLVPGPAPDAVVFVCDQPLSPRDLSALRVAFEDARAEGKVMYLHPEMSMVSVWEPREWPDAEFCAA
jgi:hypothetical protein